MRKTIWADSHGGFSYSDPDDISAELAASEQRDRDWIARELGDVPYTKPVAITMDGSVTVYADRVEFHSVDPDPVPRDWFGETVQVSAPLVVPVESLGR